MDEKPKYMVEMEYAHSLDEDENPEEWTYEDVTRDDYISEGWESKIFDSDYDIIARGSHGCVFLVRRFFGSEADAREFLSEYGGKMVGVEENG